MTSSTPPPTSPDEPTPPANPAPDHTTRPLNRNGRHWGLGLLVLLIILLVFFRADFVFLPEDNDADAVAPPLAYIVAWGLGAAVSVVAVVFARTFAFRRLGLGLLMLFLVGGFSLLLEYYYPGTFALSLALALALALLATVGLARRRSWSDARYGRQVMIVRVLCALLLVGGGVGIVQLVNRIKDNQEVEFVYRLLGMMKQYEKSMRPGSAMTTVLRYDDSLTSMQRVQRHVPLLERQIALTEDFQRQLESIETPRKYRKVVAAYAQVMAELNDDARDMKEALPQDDVDLLALFMENVETGILPAVRNLSAALREAGVDMPEDKLEETFLKTFWKKYREESMVEDYGVED